MELIVPDFVIGQNLFQKLGEDALAALKEQLTVRRRGHHDNVAAFLSLIAEIPGDDVIDDVHGLRPSAKSEDRRISFARIVVLWEHDLVMNRGSSDLHGFVKNLGLQWNTRH